MDFYFQKIAVLKKTIVSNKTTIQIILNKKFLKLTWTNSIDISLNKLILNNVNKLS